MSPSPHKLVLLLTESDEFRPSWFDPRFGPSPVCCGSLMFSSSWKQVQHTIHSFCYCRGGWILPLIFRSEISWSGPMQEIILVTFERMSSNLVHISPDGFAWLNTQLSFPFSAFIWDRLRSLLGMRWEGTLGLILLSDFHSQSCLSSRLDQIINHSKNNSSASFLSNALAKGSRLGFRAREKVG